MRKLEANTRRRNILFGALFIACATMALAPAARAASFTIPSCTALASWGGSVVSHETMLLAPRIALPKAFVEPRFSRLFGLRAEQWSGDDVALTKQKMEACYQEAKKHRDGATMRALVAGNRAIIGSLAKAIAAMVKAKGAAEVEAHAIARLPDSPDLNRGIEILLTTAPAAPDTRGLQHLPRAEAEPLYRLARTFPWLPNDVRDPLLATLKERMTRAETEMAAKIGTEIAAAPSSAAGIIALLAVERNIAALADTTARADLQAKTVARMAEIRGSLHAKNLAVWIPPSCLELYTWAAEPNARAGAPVGRAAVPNLLLDPKVIPIFGVSMSDWTDEDLSMLASVQDHCRTEARELARRKASGPLNADDRALLDASEKSGWIADKAQDALFASARTTLSRYKKAIAELDIAEAKITALPPTAASLETMRALQNSPALELVGQTEFARFQRTFNAKLTAIDAALSRDAIAGLGKVKVTKLSDLKALNEYAGQQAPRIVVESGRKAFVVAYYAALHAAALRVLPQFEEALAAMPASPEGIGEAKHAVTKLTGMSGKSELTALQPLQAAAEKRVKDIVATMRTKACDGLLKSIGVGSEANQLVWDGKSGVKLGDWICRLAGQGAQISSWSGSGLFTKSETIKITLPHQSLQTISLHKAEVLPGKTMLVGFSAKGPNEEKAFSAEQWAAFVSALEHNTMADREGCARFADIAPDQLRVEDRPYWLECGLTIAKLGGAL